LANLDLYIDRFHGHVDVQKSAGLYALARIQLALWRRKRLLLLSNQLCVERVEQVLSLWTEKLSLQLNGKCANLLRILRNKLF